MRQCCETNAHVLHVALQRIVRQVESDEEELERPQQAVEEELEERGVLSDEHADRSQGAREQQDAHAPKEPGWTKRQEKEAVCVLAAALKSCGMKQLGCRSDRGLLAQSRSGLVRTRAAQPGHVPTQPADDTHAAFICKGARQQHEAEERETSRVQHQQQDGSCCSAGVRTGPTFRLSILAQVQRLRHSSLAVGGGSGIRHAVTHESFDEQRREAKVKNGQQDEPGMAQANPTTPQRAAPTAPSRPVAGERGSSIEWVAAIVQSGALMQLSADLLHHLLSRTMSLCSLRSRREMRLVEFRCE